MQNQLKNILCKHMKMFKDFGCLGGYKRNVMQK